MTTDIKAKLDQFKYFVVIHPEYAEAMECISRSIEATMMRGEPASALVTGEPGTGKSTASKLALSLLGEKRIVTTEAGTTEIVPAFYCSLDAGATIKSLTTTMLQKLGSDNVTGNSSTLFKRLVTLLGTCETRLIVLDEFDNLLSKGAEKSREQVCDWVRTLLNETLVPVAIVGVASCEEIINAHPQLSRRYPYRHRMNHFTYSALDPASVFSKTLRALGGAIKKIGEFDKCISLSTDQSLKAMYLATGGNMNGIRHILYDAFRLALLRDDGSFGIQDLISAADLSVIPTAHYRNNAFRLTDDSLNKLISGRKGK